MKLTFQIVLIITSLLLILLVLLHKGKGGGLSDMFGGRQSARSVHFIVAWALCGFLVLHVALVLLNRPGKHVGEMITGGSADEAA